MPRPRVWGRFAGRIAQARQVRKDGTEIGVLGQGRMAYAAFDVDVG